MRKILGTLGVMLLLVLTLALLAAPASASTAVEYALMT